VLFLNRKASELLDFAIAKTKKYRISFMKTKNMRSEEVIHSELMRIWNTMLECMYIGCHTPWDPTWWINAPQSL
jgi:L-serine dehydratase